MCALMFLPVIKNVLYIFMLFLILPYVALILSSFPFIAAQLIALQGTNEVLLLL